MKRLLILGAAMLASATLPVSTSSAETIACASEVPTARTGHWYYRIIDGRKCWYQGKAMMPKSSLYWPKSSDTEANAPASRSQAAASGTQSAKPATDGRNVAAPSPSAPMEERAWPTPVVNEISFESRWLGLQSRN